VGVMFFTLVEAAYLVVVRRSSWSRGRWRWMYGENEGRKVGTLVERARESRPSS
jgi:hypothetical protein